MSGASLIILFQQPAGTPGPVNTHSFMVANAGGLDLHLGTVALEAVSGSGFAITSDGVSGRTLAAGPVDAETGEVTGLGGTATMVARFQPSGTGPAIAIIHVPSDDPGGELTITLQGNGIPTAAPAIEVDPATSWNAGDVLVAGGIATRLVTVSNPGSADLVLGTVAKTGSSFAVSSNGVTGATVPAGGSASLLLTFDPSSVGAKTGTLTIPSNAGADVVLALSGNGTVVAPVPVLVDRWYLGRQPDTSGITIGSTGWGQNDFAARQFLLTASKAGLPPGLLSSLKGTTSNDRTVGVARYATPPLAAQDLRGAAIRLYALTGRASALGDGVTAAVRFARYRTSDGTLFASGVYASASPESAWDPNTPGVRSTRRFPAGEPGSAHLPSTSSWIFVDGDRLFMDVGARVFSPTTGNVSISLGGSASSVDMPATQTNTDDTTAPWLELSTGLLVLP